MDFNRHVRRRLSDKVLRTEVKYMEPEDREAHLADIATTYFLGSESSSSEVNEESFEHLGSNYPTNRAEVLR